jgi:sulfate adenylyltransferase subunit 2
MMDNLDDNLDALEARSVFILREAYRRIRPLGMLWSIGKDSTALLWLARKAFVGRIPFPVSLLDTGMEFPEVYAFRDDLIAAWGLDYHNALCPPERWRGVILGIRRDEQATRAKDRIFSPRAADGSWNFADQPPEFWDYYQTDVPDGAHLRIHPLLHWTEIDIWRYTQRENIPFCSLYLAENGHRYRSLGEKNITLPIASDAATLDDIIAELAATSAPERAGRTMDHESEDAFERLRTGGYM